MSVGGAVLLGGLDVVDQVHQRIECRVAQVEEAVLDVFHARLQFLLRKVMAGLAGAIDLQQRTVDLVIADLESALPHVGHVAVGAGHARARVHALVPHFKFRMAGFDQLRARVGMRPLVDLLLVFDGDDVFDLDAFCPREGQALVGRLEVVRDVALAADVGAHFLARRHGVDVVVLQRPARPSARECLR